MYIGQFFYKRKVGFLVIVLFFFFTDVVPAQPLSPLSLDGTWTTASSSGFTPRFDLSSCVVDGKIYVIGGEGQNGFLNTLEVYNPTTDSWNTPVTTGAFASHFGHTSSVVNGKIYVFGGVTGGTTGPVESVTNVSVFDPSNNTWDTINNQTEGRKFTPRWDLTSCVLNGKIYVIGGDSGTLSYPYTPSNIVEIFDPSTNSWSTPPATADTLRTVYFLTASIINGKIYVIGTIGDTKYTLITQVFDPETSNWTTIEPTDSAGSRIYFTSSVLNNKIYLIGERKPDIETYDPSGNTWIVPMTTGTFTERYYSTSSAVDGKIYVMGGEMDNKVEYSNANEFFTPATDGVKNGSKNNEIKLFPNPSVSSFRLQISPSQIVTHVEFYSIMGMPVFPEYKIDNNIASVDVHSLSNGTYISRVTYFDGFHKNTISLPLVVEH